jgi:8-oxo-(d)GTP phosphatase
MGNFSTFLPFGFCLLPFAFFWFTVADMEPMDEIIAAGGLVVDSSEPDSPRVLLVHRPKYDDWSFPKGKLDPGETVEVTALREVKEETGLECRIVRELSSVHYMYTSRNGEQRPKVVYYYLMEVTGGEIAVNGYEIDEARWCTVDDALKRLRYEHDKELLAAQFNVQSPAS